MADGLRRWIGIIALSWGAFGCAEESDGTVTRIVPETRQREGTDPDGSRPDPDPDGEAPTADDAASPPDPVDPDAGPADPDAGAPPPADGAPPPDPDPDAAAPPADPDAAPPPAPDAALPEAPNSGWIGGPCHGDDDCDYPEGYCVSAAEGYPNGMCSLDCDRVCPDRDDTPVTFCVGGITVDGGSCVQRCDFDAFLHGCRPGYHCETQGRFSEPDTRRGVCVPGDPPPPMPGGCHEQLDALGLNYQPTANPGEHPNGRQDLTCDLDQPVRLASPVVGVTYRSVLNDRANPLLVACPMAQALHGLSTLLREQDVVEVGHIGTYNCRLISGTDDLSMHGLAMAIDLKTFVFSDGSFCDVEDHWEHDTVNFQTECGQWLYDLAQEMHRRRLFNYILTPNYNPGHDNHFHVDLTPGGRFIGAPGSNFGYIGPNEHGD